MSPKCANFGGLRHITKNTIKIRPWNLALQGAEVGPFWGHSVHITCSLPDVEDDIGRTTTDRAIYSEPCWRNGGDPGYRFRCCESVVTSQQLRRRRRSVLVDRNFELTANIIGATMTTPAAGDKQRCCSAVERQCAIAGPPTGGCLQDVGASDAPRRSPQLPPPLLLRLRLTRSAATRVNERHRRTTGPPPCSDETRLPFHRQRMPPNEYGCITTSQPVPTRHFDSNNRM